MSQQEFLLLMDSMYPNFFATEHIRNLPEEWIYAEMILPLGEFEPHIYDKKMEDTVSFGFYEGDYDELREKIKKVDEYWPEYFDEQHRVYCGYIDGKVACFCLIDDMGVHNINGREFKIGGPGCVGTLPEYRNKGIGLTMVKNATEILKQEGYDYSYIHYTGVAPWYEKVGYKTAMKWNKNGAV